MGSVHERRQQQQLLHHKTIFIPLFCRLSLKDIKRHSAPSDEPSSPKVSCMGQVKKRSNRVAPTPNHTYSKLKKLFSSKALLPAKTNDFKKDCDAEVVDVAELDPPLPVLKKEAAAPNLWKRRFNGAALKTLQIEIVSVAPTVSTDQFF
ncbi:uncharacterized protein LOC131014446 [Salvia miltiorrhiza]|uniref:uncharacterized protein LOC131014446 n=1 Tax=Salvia miltiorrhiza TaxID=226208 RepID=UPI0025ABB594|nr:uncharacterized protein LOC131014446 [Salvia miltiorrhiza]